MKHQLFEGDVVSSKRVIYTPSSFARSSLLYLQETGSLQAEKPHHSSRKDLASYLFFMIKTGSGTLEYAGHSYVLRQYDCVFIDCLSSYTQYSNPEDLWSLSWVHFNGSRMAAIYDKYLERSGSPVFHASHPEAFQSIMHALFDTASSESYVKDMELNEKLSSLLTCIMKDCYQEKHKRNRARSSDMEKLADYLEAHYAEKLTLQQLAEQFYINPYYLTRVFKQQYGMTIHEYLMQIRISHAKRMLRFTNDTLDTIGMQCAIGDGPYFSRIFQKSEGMSPGEFRKIWKNRS